MEDSNGTEEMSGVQAVKKFFDLDSPTMMKEWKTLSPDDKKELGEMACKALGKKLKV
jgi:hypothetical protein